MVQVILDTPTNTMTIRRRTFLGYSEVVHTLAYLSHAELDTSRSSDTPTHCPIFVLSGGMSEGHHKFTPAYQSGPGPARIVDAVNTWLNDARQNGHFPAPVDSGPPEA